MHSTDYQRPPTLYRYDQRAPLEQALTQGEFRLQPAARCLTLSFSQAWEPALFNLQGGVDSCLIIHNSEEFGERLHRAVQRALPNWAGIDGPVDYRKRSPLGATFSKTPADALEQEWLFAWRPLNSVSSLNPVVVRIGSLEAFAELRAKDTHVS
jgi:hypothetical protein